MDCAFVSCDSDYRGVWLDTRYPVAKKEHQCGECGDIIKPGEKYRKDIQIDDGDFNVYKTCEGCADCMSTFSDGTWEWNNFWYGLWASSSYGDYIPIGALDLLTDKGRAKMISQLDEMWQDDEECGE